MKSKVCDGNTAECKPKGFQDPGTACYGGGACNRDGKCLDYCEVQCKFSLYRSLRFATNITYHDIDNHNQRSILTTRDPYYPIEIHTIH